MTADYHTVMIDKIASILSLVVCFSRDSMKGNMLDYLTRKMAMQLRLVIEAASD